jgi:hypothetical protein
MTGMERRLTLHLGLCFYFFLVFFKNLKNIKLLFYLVFFNDFDVIILKIKESENIFKNIIHYITNTLRKTRKKKEKRKEKKIKRRCDGVGSHL